VSGLPLRGGAPLDVPELQTARKGGREVVTMRRAEVAGGWVIECDVYPIGGLRVEPLRPGPYRFPTRGEADAFMREAALCLEYLGCDIA
jgi:hypothetical protein